jgi:hypothetical protein
MSCETGRNRISSRAAVAAGLSEVSSKFGNTAGLLVSRTTQTADQVGQTIAPATSVAVNVLEPTGVRNRRKQIAAKQMLTGTAAALVLTGRATGLIKLLTVFSQVKRVGIISERLTGAVGTGAARLSETGLILFQVKDLDPTLEIKPDPIAQSPRDHRQPADVGQSRGNVPGQRQNLAPGHGFLSSRVAKANHHPPAGTELPRRTLLF